MIDQDHTIIWDLIINEELDFSSIPLKEEQVDDFSVFKDIVDHHESSKTYHLTPSSYIGDNYYVVVNLYSGIHDLFHKYLVNILKDFVKHLL